MKIFWRQKIFNWKKICINKIFPETVKKKCRRRGLNLGPSDLQSDALPTELQRLSVTTESFSFSNWKTFRSKQKKRGQEGFEPPTSRTQSENHTPRPLSHVWWAWRDLNPQPSGLESDALTIAPQALVVIDESEPNLSVSEKFSKTFWMKTFFSVTYHHKTLWPSG